MRKLLNGIFLTAVFASLGAVGEAQWAPAGGPYRPESVSALIDQVHMDLNRGYSVWNLSGGERGRLNHAEHELREFAQRWRNGRFDKGDLDDAIASIQHVLDNNRLSGRERDAIWRDVEQLRGLRAAYDRHEIGRW